MNIIKEVEILKSLNHPHIAKFEELIEDASKTYVVMEYVDGGSVQDLIENKCLNKTITKKILRHLVNCLRYLHLQHGVIHRDIKP